MATSDDFDAQLRDIRELQRLLDEAYAHYFEHSDGHCKSSEGYVEVRFNNYFDRRDGQPLKIEGVGVFSYVLGPHRMHDFDSPAEALAAVREWHARQLATDYSDGGPFLPVEKLLTDQPSDHVTGVPPETWNELMQDAEPEPNQALQDAAERHRAVVRKDGA